MIAREIGFEEFESLAKAHGVDLPIEQTEIWSVYERSIPGRRPWGQFALEEGGETRAVVAFADYATHGYHYLRAHHGPVWFAEPSSTDEAAAVDALSQAVKKRDNNIWFIRMSVMHELSTTRPVLSTVPYDATVVIDLTPATQEDIVASFRPRGRRDVRKSLRESPAVCADETQLALEDFAPYYKIMQETAERDGFHPAPAKDYYDFLLLLGPDHARLYAARIDGEIVAWGIDAISGARATHYYAASGTKVRGMHVNEKLLVFECVDLAARGCTSFDLMAVGSEFSPTLMGLNEYKCKYASPVAVAPDRDVPVKKTSYNMLVKLKEVRDDRRAKKAEKIALRTPAEPRDDIQPVIIGGDIGAYAIGREFHEAFGTKSICIAPSPIGAIAHSKIFAVRQTELDPDSALAAVTQVATALPDKKIVLIANTDAHIALISSIEKSLPSNVAAAIPPAQAVDIISSKTEFAKLCKQFDLPHPETEIVKLAGTDPVASTAIPFPLVAKPATSAEYMKYLGRGFKKVYFCHDQSELDALWSDLREAGFTGDFLVQKLIPGDDTAIHSITIYMATNGKATLTASSHVLLSDHAPTMLGNPVSSITQSLPDYYKKLEPMLASIGYTGFANFDLKEDPSTGVIYFLECNPRIGRNSYYVAAAGVNPMRSLVADIVDGKPGPCRDAKKEMLYTLVPLKLMQRYIRDPELLHKVDTLIAEKRVVDPQRYALDWAPRRRLDVELTENNQYRKFALYYPQPTDTAF